MSRRRAAVDYVRAATIEQGVAALQEVEGARLIAGGTDLMVALRDGRVRPSRLVDVTRIRELSEIRQDSEGLSIGAAVPVYDLINHPHIRQHMPGIVEAGRLLGGRQIQNMATVGGNICNASPAAEMAGPLLVLDAEVEVTDGSGVRRIPIETFWRGPGKTVLERGEVVTSIRIPAHVKAELSVYRRVDIRHSVDIALVSASAMLEFDGVRVRVARLALGAVAPVPLRLKEAEELLENEAIDHDVIERVRQLARAAARPISDVRASADYRLAMTGVLAGRVIELALQRSGS